jgi:hypothetical protein
MKCSEEIFFTGAMNALSTLSWKKKKSIRVLGAVNRPETEKYPPHQYVKKNWNN